MTRAIETISIPELTVFIRKRTGAKDAEISSVHQTQDPHRLFVELTGPRTRSASTDVLISSSGKPVKLLEYCEEQDKASWNWSAVDL